MQSVQLEKLAWFVLFLLVGWLVVGCFFWVPLRTLSSDRLVFTHSSDALMATLNSWLRHLQEASEETAPFILSLRQDSLGSDVGIRSAGCDRRLYTPKP